jgi:hypothetical protein
MREIKFRAWHRRKGVMTNNVSLLDVSGVAFVSDIMQFTGLKDKNGKEIYEGDAIVVSTREDAKYRYTGPVAWVQAAWHFDAPEHFPFNDDLYLWNGHCEVIGNIYETPELLPKNGQHVEQLFDQTTPDNA